jgi:hypothetical protein
MPILPDASEGINLLALLDLNDGTDNDDFHVYLKLDALDASVVKSPSVS